MQDKKFYQKAFKWLFLTLFVIVFAVSSEVAEANYTIGIVGTLMTLHFLTLWLTRKKILKQF